MPSQIQHAALPLILALSPLTALAKTDLAGCTSFTSTVTIDPTSHGYGNVYETVVYYDPDTLEICAVPDCGGGRAPPKTGVPGCPLYSGTATATASFLDDPNGVLTMVTYDGGAATAETTPAATTTTADSLSSSSGVSASTSPTSVFVVTGPDGSPNGTYTLVTGTGPMTGASSTASGAGSTVTPSASSGGITETSSGAALTVKMVGLSAVAGLVALCLA
ncbi:hypothetical protein Daus18300_010873 [Diaporthe australafricana]|uniref:Siderophore biosynthesis protein n=1 Tax=Diaporthe australafricana TaxID=127596 RepID=A0ABR3W983_9PEZI